MFFLVFEKKTMEVTARESFRIIESHHNQQEPSGLISAGNFISLISIHARRRGTLEAPLGVPEKEPARARVCVCMCVCVYVYVCVYVCVCVCACV